MEKIKYNFYDMVKEELDAAEQRPIPEEKEQRHNKALKESRLRSEAFQRTHKIVLNDGKYSVFRKLVEQSVALAKFFSMNIAAETVHSAVGIITLETDMLLLEPKDNKEYRQTIAQLFTLADRIFYFVPDNALPRTEFIFRLYDIAE